MSETDTQETWRKIIRDEPWQLSGPQAGWVYLQVGNTGYPMPEALVDVILADHDEIARVKAELRQVTDERGVVWNYKTGIEIAKGREHLAHRYDGNFHDDCVYCVFARGHGKTTGMPELDSYLATIADLRSQLEAVQAERHRYKTALEEIKTLPHWNDRSVDAAIHIAAEALRTPPA